MEGISIYEPARDKWTTYSSKTEALQAAAALHAVTLDPFHNVPPHNSPLSFALSGDGKAALADAGTLKLYDGNLWREQSADAIVKGTRAENYGKQYFTDTPMFLKNGSLQVSVNGGKMEMSASGAWRLLDSLPYQSPAPFPPGGPPILYSSPWLFGYQPLPTDNNGAKWISLGSQIYTYRYNLWTNQLSLNAPGSPFRNGRSVEQVFTDPRGKLFFMTRISDRFELVSWMPPAPVKIPAPTIHVIPRSLDSVTLRFASSGQAANKLRWRLNAGEWKEAKPTTLTELPLGNYRVEAQLIDASLQSASPVSSAAFSIRPAGPYEITTWVKSLRNGDDAARNRAAVSLVKQGDPVLPLLQGVRPKSSEIGQWWIDAVIQQIKAADSERATGGKSVL